MTVKVKPANLAGFTASPDTGKEKTLCILFRAKQQLVKHQIQITVEFVSDFPQVTTFAEAKPLMKRYGSKVVCIDDCNQAVPA